MIAFSFEAPDLVKIGRGPIVVVIVIDGRNLDRMQEGDPLDLQFKKYSGHWNVQAPIGDVDLILAYEADLEVIKAYLDRHDGDGLLRHLERGRRHRPGDAVPPVKMPIGGEPS